MLRAKTLIISMSKRKAKRPMQAQEHGSQVAMLRRPIEVGERFEPGTTRRVTGARVKHECRLDWYNERAIINDRQHAAGIRFRGDWLIGTAEPRVIAGYAQALAGSAEFSELRISARRRVRRALDALVPANGTPAQLLVIVAVCGQDEWAHKGTQMLREGLDRLANHYGLSKGG